MKNNTKKKKVLLKRHRQSSDQNLKRVNNQSYSANEQIHQKESKIINNEEIKSQSSMLKNKQKIPQSIKNTIKQQAKSTNSDNDSNISKMFKSVSRKKFICHICQSEYPVAQYAKIGKCSHRFCESCLQHYVIYKIGLFEDVFCPEEDCHQNVDMEQNFFKRLPKDIQKKYKKIHLFHQTAKNPHLRLCPNEKCDEGVLVMKQGESPKCQKCDKIFCEKCMFPKHDGVCDNNQIKYFENNLHYRQCRKCKAIIELAIGCNHMTCKCGHQFCYICGEDWVSYSHFCITQLQRMTIERPSQCLEGIDTNTWFGKFCGGLIKIFILLPLYLVINLFCKLPFTLFFSVTITLFMIAFGSVCGILKVFQLTQNSVLKVFMCIFLPITMLCSIGIHFYNAMTEIVLPLLVNCLSEMARDFINFFCW